MRIKDRLLFFRYAIPCASGTLVKRGRITQERVDRMTAEVSEGIEPAEGSEAVFKVAIALLDRHAGLMGKDCVDAEVIRRYFLLEHSAVVDERAALMGDFDPSSCKTYAGRVISVADGNAVVESRLGRHEYRTDFAKGLTEGENVVVHWDFVVERIPQSAVDAMESARVKYEKGE